MTQDIKEKIQLERIEDMLIQDILETSDEEILAEFSAEYDNSEKEINHMKELIKESVFKNNKSKFEAAKKARLQRKELPEQVLKVIPFNRKQEILKSLSSNDDIKGKITMAARNEKELSESDLDVYWKCLIKQGVLDEEGNVLCEDD